MDLDQIVAEQCVAHGASVHGGRLVIRQRLVGRKSQLARTRARWFSTVAWKIAISSAAIGAATTVGRPSAKEACGFIGQLARVCGFVVGPGRTAVWQARSRDQPGRRCKPRPGQLPKRVRRQPASGAHGTESRALSGPAIGPSDAPGPECNVERRTGPLAANPERNVLTAVGRLTVRKGAVRCYTTVFAGQFVMQSLPRTPVPARRGQRRPARQTGDTRQSGWGQHARPVSPGG